jgi:hypothetical protein
METAVPQIAQYKQDIFVLIPILMRVYVKSALNFVRFVVTTQLARLVIWAIPTTGQFVQLIVLQFQTVQYALTTEVLNARIVRWGTILVIQTPVIRNAGTDS